MKSLLKVLGFMVDVGACIVLCGLVFVLIPYAITNFVPILLGLCAWLLFRWITRKPRETEA